MTESSSDFLLEAELASTTNGRMSSAAYTRRNEQLKRWAVSDTNKEPMLRKRGKSRVNFDEDYVFLSACQGADYDEISRLLKQGADINTCNVDGLTALHQACIDGKIELVRFLIDNTAGADVNRGDNEGWTPLHATASCGFIDIAELLVARHARLDLVNNDGDLAVDIADEPSMQQFLGGAMMRQGIDADKARAQEENQMLQDSLLLAQLRQREETLPMPKHPVTGATPLHVAAAKGYHQVMLNLLRTSNADPNALDNDGWTPFIAAAHWGQRESCRILAEHGGCNTEAVTFLGQGALDLAHEDLIDYLTELQKRYAGTKRKVTTQPLAAVQLPQQQANGTAAAATKRIRPTLLTSIGSNKENMPTEPANAGRISPTSRGAAAPTTSTAAATTVPLLQRQTSVTRVTQDEKKVLHRVEASMERNELEQAATTSPAQTQKIPLIRTDSGNASTQAGHLRSRALLSNREATPVAQRTLMMMGMSPSSLSSTPQKQQQSPQVMAKQLRSKSIDAAINNDTETGTATKPPYNAGRPVVPVVTPPANKNTFTQPFSPPSVTAAAGVTLRRPVQLSIPSPVPSRPLLVAPTKTSAAVVATSTPQSVGSLENLTNAKVAQLDADTAVTRPYSNVDGNDLVSPPFMQANAASSTHKLPLLPGGKLRATTTLSGEPNASSSSSTSPAGSVASGSGAPASSTTTTSTHASRPLISPLHTVTVRRSTISKPGISGKDGAASGTTGVTSSEQLVAESESQRKAHARRVRETRRSTQGVSAEDVKNAQIELAASSVSNKSDSNAGVVAASARNVAFVSAEVSPSEQANKTVNLIPPISLASTGVQVQQSKREVSAIKPTTPEPVVTLRLPPQRPTFSDAENPNALRIPEPGLWMSGGGSSPDFDQTRGTSASAAVILPSNNPAVQRRRRPKRRSTGVVSVQQVVQLQSYPSTSTTSKLIPAASARRQQVGSNSGSGDGNENDAEADNDDDNEEEGEQVGEGKCVTNNSSKQNSNDNRISTLQDELRQKDAELQQTKARLKQILSMSTSAVPVLQQQQAAKVASGLSTTTTSGGLNRRLPPPDNTVASTSGTSASGSEVSAGAAAGGGSAPVTMTPAARQDEKMALIKRLSELEEQIKELERLKSDNQRLKDENSALIRVISKLSK